MNKLTQLDITVENLPFSAYQTRGFEFGILYTQDIKIVLPFLYTFFINIRMQKIDLGQKFNFVFDKISWFEEYNVFEYKQYTFPVLPSQEEYINSIKDNIDNGFYASSGFDEYYVPGKDFYHKRRFAHTFLMYGYNDNLQEVHLIGYTKNGKFEKYSIKYSDMYNALWYNNTRTMHYRKLNEKFEYKFDLLKCYEELHQYLNSIYIGVGRKDDEVYGLEANDGFRKYVYDTILQTKPIDIRYSRFFFEHKEFMLKRMEFLHKEGLAEDYISQYEKVSYTYKNIHMILLKYNLTGKISSLEKIYEMLQEANDIEKRILNNVLYDLKKHLPKETVSNYQLRLQSDKRNTVREKSRIYNTLDVLRTYTNSSCRLTTNEILEYLSSKNIISTKRLLINDINKLIEMGIDINIINEGINYYYLSEDKQNK